jgi:hypothetical protein
MNPAWQGAQNEVGEAATVDLTFLFAVKTHDKTLLHMRQSFVNHHTTSSLDLASLAGLTRF